MKSETIDKYSGEITYRQLADQLKERRRSGERELPAFRELAAAYDVSLGVVQRAVKTLRDEGYIQTQRNIGSTWVEGRHPEPEPCKIGVIHPYAPDRESLLVHNWALHQAFAENRVDGIGIFRYSRGIPEEEAALANRLLRLRVNGIMISPGESPDVGFFERLAKTVPVIAIDNVLTGSPLPAVLHDYRGAGVEIARTLKRKKRRRLLLVQNETGNNSTREIAEALRDGIDSDEIKLPLLSAATACETGDYSQFREVGRALATALAAKDYDSIFCPYDTCFDRLYADCLNSELRENLLPVLIASNRPAWYSETLVKSETMFWVHCPDVMMKTALDRLLNWTAGHQPTTGTKRIKLIRTELNYK